ncbi:MAG: M23 family metallopeptidase [Acidobacteria bacterium]|jgi:murein DD-endopeptidase MepM/ murein hydrolase activator NlpD|nr:M23 family metallopeptidase [Acidobacteriota bacterium]
MKILTALAALLLLLLLPAHAPPWLDAVPPVENEPLTIVQGSFGHNETLATALEEQLSPAAIHRLVEAARPTYDLARVTVGRPFAVALGPDGLLRAFTYGIDDLRTLRVIRHGDDLETEVLTRTYDSRAAVVAGEIESSLFATIEATGEHPQLAFDLAEIFAWDIDFNTEIQAGDAFRVAVEKLSLDGRFVRYGRILAATFQRGQRTLYAVRYEGSQGAGYYDLEGVPLRKAFLRSPLRFTRISSRFSRRRLHPILKERRPHLGIDYAAPLGTPVMAASDGVVISAGWSGGYGRTVRLRHANGYQTLYGHLSRISVRRGQRVSQGEKIGAVGKTGLATGPHLDYRMSLNGQYVDPLRIQLPPAEPIPHDELDAFIVAMNRHLALLEGREDTAPRTASAAL